MANYRLRIGHPVIPSWRTAMAVNTWAEIPSTTTITSIAPFTNTSLRPPGADWIGNGTPFAWTGFSWDDTTLTWYAGMLGGHTDYGGNEPYKVSLATESTVWEMIRLPSGAVGGPALTARDGNETDGTGLYSDGRLRAHHTYGNHRFVPGVGLVVCRSTGHFYSGTGDTKRIWTIDTTTGEATERCNYTAYTQMGGGEASVDYDPVRDCLWSMGSSTSTLLQITDLASATWTATKRGIWDNHMYGSGCLRYVPNADAIALFPTPGGSGFGVINPTTYAKTFPTLSGSFSSGLVTTAAVVVFGMEWCSDLGCFLLWNNTSSTTQISTLTPSNPTDATQPWVKGVLTVGGSNTVTPPAAPAGDGVGSRFTYSESLGCVLLQTAANSPIYAYATR